MIWHATLGRRSLGLYSREARSMPTFSMYLPTKARITYELACKRTAGPEIKLKLTTKTYFWSAEAQEVGSGFHLKPAWAD